MKPKSLVIIISILISFLLSISTSTFAGTERIADDTTVPRQFSVGYVEWMPFSGRDKKGNPIGMDIEILKAVFSKIGNYTPMFTYVEWKDSMLNVLQETLDSSWVCYITKNRMKAFDYTTYYNYEYLHVFVQSNSDLKFNGIKDLEGKKVMIAFGYSAGDEYDTNRNIIKMTARTDEQALQELAENNIDAVITGEYVGYYYIKKHNLFGKIKMLKKPIGLFPLHGLVKKYRHFDFIKVFEIAMLQTIQEGTVQRIRNKWKNKLNFSSEKLTK